MALLLSLNGEWNWKEAGSSISHRGAVPGSVLLDMLNAGMIEDPFWRTNEYATRELMMKDYTYFRTFDISASDLEHEIIEIVCEGLDTIATLFINGVEIAHVNDMHRTYRFNVKPYLKVGVNDIEVFFSSSLKYVRECDEKSDIFYASTGSIHGNGYLRKSHCSFGWDWGPQLPDAGIFRPIYLEAVDGARFNDVQIIQEHAGSVKLTLKNSVELISATEADLKIRAILKTPNGISFTKEVACSEELSFIIDNPELWWPNNIGNQPMYSITWELLRNGETIDVVSKRIGLRTIEVSTAKDEWGEEFCFVVNGKKIFAMGANYIPQDSLITRVTPERYRKLIDDSVEANFNCIRVWGGGYYPDDCFYDYCDEKGIIIWQDLMFACNVYTLTDDFEQNIIAETRDNVRRLRHHACLGLWCGNNEMEWGGADMWERLRGHHTRYKADYTKIFEYIIPKVVKENDNVTFFWPSSPSSGGGYDDPYSFNRGDQHYWEVWHSGKPFTEYRKNFFRFCSEYGFQSFPSMKTIKSFAIAEDMNIFSKVMESHQKNGVANGKIFSYISDYFYYPDSMASIAYISQVLQLKAIQYGVEHWRRNRPRCMGSLYWQLNDCYPVASWASIDYYGRWKALHYGARHFYAPVTISACEKEEFSPVITYYFHNETLNKVTGKVRILLKDNTFNTLYEKIFLVDCDELSVNEITTCDFSSYLKSDEDKENKYAVIELLDENDKIKEQRVTLFTKPKRFAFSKPEYLVDIVDKGDVFEISIKSDVYAAYTEVSFNHHDALFSDNFFDITTVDGVVISVKKEGTLANTTASELLDDIRVFSVADSYSFPKEVLI